MSHATSLANRQIVPDHPSRLIRPYTSNADSVTKEVRFDMGLEARERSVGLRSGSIGAWSMPDERHDTEDEFLLHNPPVVKQHSSEGRNERVGLQTRRRKKKGEPGPVSYGQLAGEERDRKRSEDKALALGDPRRLDPHNKTHPGMFHSTNTDSLGPTYNPTPPVGRKDYDKRSSLEQTHEKEQKEEAKSPQPNFQYQAHSFNWRGHIYIFYFLHSYWLIGKT